MNSHFIYLADAASSAGLDSAANVRITNPIDIVIIIAYVVGIVLIGCFAGKLSRKKNHGSGEAQDYFLAGGTLKWPVIGLALFATNISTVHLVSLAQAGFDTGLLNGNFEWMAGFTLVLLALFFAPFFIRSKVATLPDFLEKRYNRASRDILSILSIASAILVHIGFALYTGAVVLNGMFGLDIVASVIGIAILTGIYTVIGGLMAVVLTESIQTIILLVGAIVITLIAYLKLGSWEALVNNVEPIKLSMLHTTEEAKAVAGGKPGLPWYAVLLGYPVLGIWYWCTDQTIVQRVLGAKDENHARVGALFAGFIKILPVFIFVLPGLMCAALIQSGQLDIAGMSTKADGSPDSGDTYAFMIRELLPVGVKGIVAAALLSALMSTVSGALNSISTLTAYDLFKRFKPGSSDRQLVTVGRIAALIAMVLAIVWSIVLPQFDKGGLFNAMVSVIVNIAPPISAVFLWGVFWKRASGTAAVWTLVIGAILGIASYIISQNPPVWFQNLALPDLMVAFYLFVICSLVLLVVSILKPHEHTTESEKLVWSSPLEPLRDTGWKGIGNYKLLSLILIVTMVVLYGIFQ